MARHGCNSGSPHKVNFSAIPASSGPASEDKLVAVDSEDSTPDYLAPKLIAGEGVTITKQDNVISGCPIGKTFYTEDFENFPQNSGLQTTGGVFSLTDEATLHTTFRGWGAAPNIKHTAQTIVLDYDVTGFNANPKLYQNAVLLKDFGVMPYNPTQNSGNGYGSVIDITFNNVTSPSVWNCDLKVTLYNYDNGVETLFDEFTINANIWFSPTTDIIVYSTFSFGYEFNNYFVGDGLPEDCTGLVTDKKLEIASQSLFFVSLPMHFGGDIPLTLNQVLPPLCGSGSWGTTQDTMGHYNGSTEDSIFAYNVAIQSFTTNVEDAHIHFKIGYIPADGTQTSFFNAANVDFVELIEIQMDLRLRIKTFFSRSFL